MDLEERAHILIAEMVAKGGGDICGEFGAAFPAEVETAWLNLDPAVAPVLCETATSWASHLSSVVLVFSVLTLLELLTHRSTLGETWKRTKSP
jgi:hypothetical protein